MLRACASGGDDKPGFLRYPDTNENGLPKGKPLFMSTSSNEKKRSVALLAALWNFDKIADMRALRKLYGAR